MVRSQLDLACQTFSYMDTDLILSHLLQPSLGDFKAVNHKFEGIEFENIVWIWCSPTFLPGDFFMHIFGLRCTGLQQLIFVIKKSFSHAKKSSFTVFVMSNLGLTCINTVYNISL